MMIRHVILPGAGADLLRYELALAFAEQGLRVTIASEADLHNQAGDKRLEILLEDGPALLFSVNFQGLQPLKPVLELLQRAGGLAAVWMVDNPWNILSGVRDPRWRTLPLFVTDASFVAPLTAHGAIGARHLPLAASFAHFDTDQWRGQFLSPPEDIAPFAFVGRSAFPGKDSFFAGQSLPPGSLEAALAMLVNGKRPDLVWWEKQCGTTGEMFWPGKKGRTPAFGAEEANLAWRGACIGAAAEVGVDVFGDAGWPRLEGLKKITGRLRFLGPVDYYTRLPGIYRAARYSLCPTSLQLPSGLSQRHFDVWAAGGLALVDASPGLCIFPEELVRPIVFSKAEDIVPLAERLEASNQRRGLVEDWRQCLASGHSYAHRVQTVLQALGDGKS